MKAERGGEWKTVTVLFDSPDGPKEPADPIFVSWEGLTASNDESISRKRVIIAQKALEELEARKNGRASSVGAPIAEKKADTNADKMLRDRTAARLAKSYSMRSAIPPDSEKVAAMTLIPKGTKMQIEWGGRWLPVTALQDSSEGPIQIHWDNYGDSWDEPVNRDSIVIDKKTQAELAKSKADKP